MNIERPRSFCMRTAERVCAVLSALLAAGAFASAPDLTDSLEYLGNPAYSHWPNHPHSRQVLDLAPHKGRIFVSGGDWSPNMGPCPIFAVDPYTGAYTNEFTAGTDDIYEFKEFSDGRLYASAVDPTGSGSSYGSTFRRGYDGVWKAYNTAGKASYLDPATDNGSHEGYMIHNWDMTEWNEYTFVCGYGISGSTNWCETAMFDATPQIRFIERELWQGATVQRRFAAFLPFADDVYCIPTQPAWSDDLQCCDWEEWRWIESEQRFVCQTNTWDNIAPGVTAASTSLTQFPANGGGKTLQLWHPTKFKGRVLYVLAEAYPLVPWAAFSAQNVNHHVKATKIDLGGDDVKPYDICVAGDAAYIVAAQAGSTATAVTNSVWKSTDGVSFTKILTFTASRPATAICYFDGCFYFGMGGTKDTAYGWPNLPSSPELSGNIYRVRLPQGDAVQVLAGSSSAYVPEGGSADVSFRLASAPATNMTLDVCATDPIIGLSVSQLVFTQSNWNEPQTVRISIPEDEVEKSVRGAVVCGTGGDDCVSGFVQIDMLDDEGDLTTPISGEVTDKSSYWDVNLQAEHAFDGNYVDAAGRWLARRKDHMYVVYKFNEAATVNMLRVWNGSDTYGGYDSAGRSPKAWTFLGSNDGRNWTVLDTVTDETGWSSTGEMRAYSFQNGTAYQYYKYDCTALNDEVSLSRNSDNQPEAQVLQLWELEFLYRAENDPTPPDLDPDHDGSVDFYVSVTGDDANSGTEASPFATLGAATTAANAAIDGGAESAVVHVGAGTYTGSGYELDRAITVIGEDGTVFDGNGGYRVFSLTSSGAALKGLVVSNGVFTAAGQSGAGVYMVAGLVEDCVIASCGSFNPSKTLGGGIYASGGRISRTVFTDCRVHTRWSGDVGYGSALYLSNGAICENSLFTGNAAASCFNWDATHRRGGVVHLTGSGTALVNCTVVKNELADASGNNNNNYAGIVQKSDATVVNCVACMNRPDAAFVESSGDVYVASAECFVNSAWGDSITAAESPIVVGASAFADCAGGDFRLSAGSQLLDAGSDAGYASCAVSATDIAGNVRLQGNAIDIGCYETDLNAVELTVGAGSYAVLLGAESSFTAVATGGGGSCTYRWDFGDGSAAQTTADASVLHTYAAAGLYRASVSASTDNGATWCATAELPGAIVVAPADIYVDAASANPVFPYDTPAKAAASFAAAYGCLTNTVPATPDMAVVDGVTIHVAAGTYVGSKYVLAGAITVLGAGADSAVIDGNGGFRVFSLLSSGAVLRNIAVSNGVFTTDEQSGAGAYMEAGLVEDCRIASCGSFTPIKTLGGGIYASGGRISRTVFTGNKVHMRWSAYIGYGSALYLSNGAICENSLFTGNAAAPCYDWDATHRRGGVAHLTDAGTALVNCTVVKNRLADAKGNGTTDYAGIVQKKYSKVVNCVAYGNEPDPGDAYTVTGYWDVYAGGDEWRNNWQNFFSNSAWGTALSKDDSPVSPVGVSEASFMNWANGIYMPKVGGGLANAGTNWAGYLGAGAVSLTDISGSSRSRGFAVDIGCYESLSGVCVILR